MPERVSLKRRLIVPLGLLALAGCSGGGHSAGPVPGDPGDQRPYSGIAESETAHFTGTEPFWGGNVVGDTLVYSTPDNAAGSTIAVERFAGRGGLSWHGIYRGQPFVLAVTPGKCSDGMSDRTYPYVATLSVEGTQRNGCAWTDRQPFSGPSEP
ncbi:COG3650 family protein [Tsuneonella mangrovi]|uniref:COG3650 family protein n=1 Tax=Tsuneonella mangrovi TaxID=1982042 RepID=UPI001F0A08E1|nr:hypothetical protein [Tsuneonella mangrovi]